MKLIFKIAWRYITGKKTTNVINIITWMSMLGIAIGTAAMIIVLSIFNGFEGLIDSMSRSTSPDLLVQPIEGKFFDIDQNSLNEIKNLQGIKAVSRTIEEISIFDYKNTQKAGKIKGVDETFKAVTGIDTSLHTGKYILKGGEYDFAIVGRGLAANLGVNLLDDLSPITAYMPLRKKKGVLDKMGKDFKSLNVYPKATFHSGANADIDYVLTNYEFVNKLLGFTDKCSALEIDIDNASEKSVKESMGKILGSNFTIKNRYEQNEEFMKLMNIEKWAAFMIIALVLLIIAFNLVGALWMMVLEKKKDISILSSMGMPQNHVTRIFLVMGAMVVGLGLLIGIIIGISFYFIQDQFGIISVPNGFVMDAYPIKMKLMDIIIVILTVLLIGILGSLLPSYRAGKISTSFRNE